MILSENIQDYFNDFFAIATENQYLTADFVDSVERRYLQMLLGTDTFIELDNNLVNGVTTCNKWNDFINGTTYEFEGNQYIYSGIKDILQGFVYFEIYRLMNTSQSVIGNVKLQRQNSSQISYGQNESDYFERFNNSVKLTNDMVYFLLHNNIKNNKTATAINDNLDGTYTIISDTENICKDSRIYLNSKFYNAINILPTSFDILAEQGILFDLNFYFYLYNNVIILNLARKLQIDY